MDDDFELIHGSGNVFRDFGDPNADLEQARAILAAKIIAAMDQQSLTPQTAHKLTGIPASEFSAVRALKLDPFDIDRMVTILDRIESKTIT